MDKFSEWNRLTEGHRLYPFLINLIIDLECVRVSKEFVHHVSLRSKIAKGGIILVMIIQPGLIPLQEFPKSLESSVLLRLL